MKILYCSIVTLGIALSTQSVLAFADQGKASFYWQDQKTANGERFNKNDLTAAHRSLPFGTLVRVTRVKTGKSVVVRINDRGPFIRGRIIDLSQKAAQSIGLTHKVGVTEVKLDVISKPKKKI